VEPVKVSLEVEASGGANDSSPFAFERASSAIEVLLAIETNCIHVVAEVPRASERRSPDIFLERQRFKNAPELSGPAFHAPAHSVTIGNKGLRRCRLLFYLIDLECDPICLLERDRTCAEVRAVRPLQAKIGRGVAYSDFKSKARCDASITRLKQRGKKRAP
jgi:hypothetical protein